MEDQYQEAYAAGYDDAARHGAMVTRQLRAEQDAYLADIRRLIGHLASECRTANQLRKVSPEGTQIYIYHIRRHILAEVVAVWRRATR